MPPDIDAVFRIIAPATYWIIAIIWAAIFFLLVKRATIFRGHQDVLKILVVVLAIDAFRTFIESVYFGALFNAYFGFFPESIQAILESPVLLAIPKLINIAAGALVLFLIVRRWIPKADHDREREIVREAVDKAVLTEELKAEKERLIRAQAVAKVGSWETNLATLEVNWSAETFRIFEQDASTFVPTHERFLALVHPEDRAAVDEAFRRSYDSSEVREVEHRMVTRDGRVKIISERWQTFLDQGGAPSRAVGTCQDLTEFRATESKSLEAADQLRLAGDVALLGAWSYNVGDEQVNWSEQTASIHEMPKGFKPTIAEGIEFYAPEYRKKIQSVFTECLESGEKFNETLEIITAHGRRVWVRAIGEAVRDDKGKITKVHGAFQDISAIVESQKHLKLLEAAISRLNDIVMITEAYPIDEPGPRIVFVNKAFEQLTEYTASEALGKTPRILQSEQTQRYELDRLRSAMEHKKSVRVEIINRSKSGHNYWLEIDLTPILDEGGNCTHFVAIERDITERKAREDALVEISSRLDTLIAQAPVGILVHHNFKPIIANDELAKIFGYGSKGEIVKMESCIELFADDEKERIAAYNSSRMAGDATTGIYSVKGKRKDGSIFELENRAFAVQWGERLSVCAMLTDVSNQRKTEAQLRQAQRLEAVGQMTGGVAHDFNNLLTVILGNAEFLEDGLADNPDMQSMAELTRKAAERGADLTNRLLAFSRQQALSPAVIDLNVLVASTEALLGRALDANVEIKIIQDPGLWSVLIDAPQFESAILNLAVNARDAMPNGGCLTIEVSNIEFDGTLMADNSEIPPGHYVCCSVSDTGTGMDEDTRQRAFEPFFTTKDVGKGSGLGLSMVYGLVKQSNGYIRIYSEVGHGTIFKIYLPRELGAASSVQAQSGSLLRSDSNERILVVEDDDLVRQQVTTQLQSLGYQIVSARNGAEALGILKRTADFDLLFTDVVMPGGMNGPRLAEEALKLHPALPVLFTSGYTENAVIHHGILDSGVNLLNKPYRRQELAAKVRSVLDKSQKPFLMI